MPERQLVLKAEKVLHLGGGWALFAAVLIRLAVGFILERQTWLLDSQLLAVPVVLAALILCACLLPRAPGYLASGVLGGGAWLLGLSLLPRYGWPRGEVAAWLLYAATAALLLALAYRAAKLRRWQIAIRGHGFEWLHAWAAEKPLAARLLAQSALRGLLPRR